jgi:hypothetical protein
MMEPEQQKREEPGFPGSTFEESYFLGSTLLALAIICVFYPMTIAPMGGLSNGGALGLGSLVIASALAWRAFIFNRDSRWLRRFVQLPLTAMATYLAIAEAVAQYRSWHWLWL